MRTTHLQTIRVSVDTRYGQKDGQTPFNEVGGQAQMWKNPGRHCRQTFSQTHNRIIPILYLKLD